MAIRGAGTAARVAVVALVAALASITVLRAAAVADRGARPALAQSLWPSHPSVMTDRVLLAIAVRAARGQAVPPATRDDVRRIATKAPLSPDPFLIEGAIAETEGKSRAAELLLLAARDRDPRSRGTRYLLAERYFRTGRITDALIEMQALVNLQSRGLEVFVPALVSYAQTPGAVPQLKAYFLKYPQVELAVLSVLALDPANADLVFALANDPPTGSRWQRNLVTALVRDGQYARARSVWARPGAVHPQTELFNPRFADSAAPPPFNWDYPESGEGVAEPDGKGGIDVLYYGRANAVLASQLLLLPAGHYALTSRVTEASGEVGAIQWVVRCTRPKSTIARLPLREGSSAVSFAIPADCDAQWLELQGVADDLPRTTELKLHGLQLSPGGRQ